MLNKYEKYNEARRPKARQRTVINKGRPVASSSFNNQHVQIQLQLVISKRLEYIITKMSETGNPVSKEILKCLGNKDRKFDISFIDLNKNADMLTFTGKGDKITDSPFETSKRTSAKAYKVIRILFDNKFTKNEIEKFVSLYKGIFMKGPPKAAKPKEESYSPPPKTKELPPKETVEKILQDTKSGKLVWKEVAKNPNMDKYNAIITMTNSKYLELELYLFPAEENNFLVFNLCMDHKKIFIKNIIFDKNGLLDLCKELKELI